MPNISTSTYPPQVSGGRQSTTLHSEDARLAILSEYRRRQAEVFRATRVARDAANFVSIAEEWAADTQGRLLRDLRRNGPIVHDGRRYAAEKVGGIVCVVARSEEGGGN